MFGFFRFKASVRNGIKAVQLVLTPAEQVAEWHSKQIPAAIFGDAYILGFLQSMLMGVVISERGKLVPPQELMRIHMTVMDSCVPDLGSAMPAAISEVNDPAHPHHTHYTAGREDGYKYVEAINNGNGEEAGNYISGLTDFIKRNYLGVE